RIRFRHDQHHRVARGDDAADGVDRELMHHAVLGRAQVDALELVLRRHLALAELADLALDLAELFRDVAAEILIDLDDLKLDLADLAAGLRRCGDRLRALALEPRRLPFERDQPIELYQVLVPQPPYAFELAPDQLELFGFGRLQRGIAADFLVELRD